MRGEKRGEKLHNIGRPKKEIDKRLAERLKKLRGKRSRQQFIDEVGLTQINNSDEAMTVEQYRQYENLTRNAPDKVIKKICEHFNITEYEFLGIPEPDVDSINHQHELYAELMADYDIWNLLTYAKRLGYEINTISEDISIVILKGNGKTLEYTYSQLKNLTKEIEKLLEDNSSNNAEL
ncbi:MAG: helix-turn-helix domain-containing protein [Clostridia bacterium]|nr:helix-turn-helix domain-containing protein [Clostridia bacterium]